MPTDPFFFLLWGSLGALGLIVTLIGGAAAIGKRRNNKRMQRILSEFT